MAAVLVTPPLMHMHVPGDVPAVLNSALESHAAASCSFIDTLTSHTWLEGDAPVVPSA